MSDTILRVVLICGTLALAPLAARYVARKLVDWFGFFNH